MKSLSIINLASTDATEVDISIVATGKPTLCRGLHKLLQLAVLYVTTARGSISSMPDFGNAYIYDFTTPQLSLLQSTEQIDAAISQLNSDLEAYLRDATVGLPLDEQLGSLVMQQTTGQESLYVRLTITSAAGATAQYDYNLLSELP